MTPNCAAGHTAQNRLYVQLYPSAAHNSLKRAVAESDQRRDDAGRGDELEEEAWKGRGMGTEETVTVDSEEEGRGTEGSEEGTEEEESEDDGKDGGIESDEEVLEDLWQGTEAT
jgi:hypothetical protein